MSSYLRSLMDRMDSDRRVIDSWRQQREVNPFLSEAEETIGDEDSPLKRLRKIGVDMWRKFTETRQERVAPPPEQDVFAESRQQVEAPPMKTSLQAMGDIFRGSVSPVGELRGEAGGNPPYEEFRNEYWKQAGAPDILFENIGGLTPKETREALNSLGEWEDKAKVAYDARYGEGAAGTAIRVGVGGKIGGIATIASNIMEPQKGFGATTPLDIGFGALDVAVGGAIAKPIIKKGIQLAREAAPAVGRTLAEAAAGEAGAIGKGAGKAKPVVPEVPVAPVGKEAWQMTREEYIKQGTSRTNLPPELDHRGSVFQALERGDSVPPEVLKDYPDLAAKVPKVEPPQVPLSKEPDRFLDVTQARRLLSESGLSKTDESKVWGDILRVEKEQRKSGQLGGARGWDESAIKDAVNKYLVSKETTKQDVALLAKAKDLATRDERVKQRLMALQSAEMQLESIRAKHGLSGVAWGEKNIGHMVSAQQAEIRRLKNEVISAVKLSSENLPPVPLTKAEGAEPKRPMVNPHASAIQQDKQKLAQIRWDKEHKPPETPVSPKIPTAEAKPTIPPARAPETPSVPPPPKEPPTAVAAAPEPKPTPIQNVRTFYKAKIEEIKAATADKVESLKDWQKYTVAEKQRIMDDIIAANKGASEDTIASLKDWQKYTVEEQSRIVSDFYKAKIADLKGVNADKIASLKDWAKYTVDEQARVKGILTDYVQAHLPLAERGKLLDAVRLIKSQEGLDEVLARVDRIAEWAGQKALRSQITKELARTETKKVQGILKGRLTPEVQKQLDDIRSVTDMNRGQAQDKIASQIDAYHNGQMSYDDMVRQNEALRHAGIKEMSTDELQGLLAEIQELKATGRIARIERETLRKERMATLNSELGNVISGGKGVKPGVGTIPPEAINVKRSIRDRIPNWNYGIPDLLDKLSKFHKTSKEFASPLSKWGEIIDVARSAEYAGLDDSLAKLQQIATDAFGVTNKSDLNKVLNRSKEKVKLGIFTNARGEKLPVELTRGQMMTLYNQMKDETLEATFREGMAWTDMMKNAVKNTLTPQEKAYADGVMKFLSEYYDSINKVYREIYHVDLPRRVDYFPAFRQKDTDIPELIKLMQQGNRYAGVKAKSLIARVDNKIPLQFADINEVVTNHITEMEHFKAWAQPMSELRGVFGDDYIRTLIKQYHGTDILGTMDNYLNQLARDGVDRAKIVKVLDYIRNGFSASVLGAKPWVAAKQPLAVLSYATAMPAKDFVTGYTSFWRSPIKNYREMVAKSPYLKNRFGTGFERDIKAFMARKPAGQISGTQNIKDTLFLGIRYGDRAGAAPGAWAEYQRALKTMSDGDAIASAERLTKRVQSTSEIETLSAIQNAGSLGKFVTQFQTEPNKAFRIVANNLRNMKYGRIDKKTGIKNVIIAWAVIPAAFQWMSDGFQAKPARLARAILLGPVNNLLVGGSIAQSVSGWLTGETYDYQASPALSTGQDLARGLMKVYQMAKKGIDPTKDITMEDVMYSLEYLTKVAGVATGLPGGYAAQVSRAIREGKPLGLVLPKSAMPEEEKEMDWSKLGGTASPFGGRSSIPNPFRDRRESRIVPNPFRR